MLSYPTLSSSNSHASIVLWYIRQYIGNQLHMIDCSSYFKNKLNSDYFFLFICKYKLHLYFFFLSEMVTLLKLQKQQQKKPYTSQWHSTQSAKLRETDPFTTIHNNDTKYQWRTLCPIDYLHIIISLYIKDTWARGWKTLPEIWSYKNTSFSSELQCIKKVKGQLTWQHNHLWITFYRPES